MCIYNYTNLSLSLCAHVYVCNCACDLCTYAHMGVYVHACTKTQTDKHTNKLSHAYIVSDASVSQSVSQCLNVSVSARAYRQVMARSCRTHSMSVRVWLGVGCRQDLTFRSVAG